MAEISRVFGHIGGYAVGSSFANRQELHDSAIHRPLQGGISGSSVEGADSIVVSGGYEDDEDYGDVIIYTGQGGNVGGVQVEDQRFERGNRALAVSCDRGLPVRVVRGRAGDPAHSPQEGFRYDGLFYVADYWSDTGHSGYQIYRYRLHALSESEPRLNASPLFGAGEKAGRIPTTIQRIVRNTEVTNWVKDLYDYTCQICGRRLETPSGAYAEGAHIRPLGRPHDGPDSAGNVLCLCPNDHVLFDRGSLVISDELQVLVATSREVIGSLHIDESHPVDLRQLGYHRNHRSPEG